MQLGDDLQNVWMMFDRIKGVQGWTTMAYHIYDPVYCKVMMKKMPIHEHVSMSMNKKLFF
jgi:hypothetical protein